ncbi:MAG TPA: pyridoxal-phosphate dependent enzyme [Haliangiales bacterium]|nr:pyridoxal-phosphate dependent enzyme [Haliangiales bacterium]
MDAAALARGGLIRRTPLVRWGDARVKLENLQNTGSFKVRGAALRLGALRDDERARGVVAASAGNHGLGVAAAGRALGIRVEIIVPRTAPEVKRRGIAALGATVVEAGAGYDEAERAARARAAVTGAVFVSAYDDPWVQWGNGGTLAEEILEQAPDVKRVACPVGGGGMISGMAQVLAPRGVQLIGVQPAANCAMSESLRLGRALTEYEGRPTLAEGCEGAVATSTFEICRRHGVTIVLVDEDAIRSAIAFAYRELGQIVEPSAAVAIAGVRERCVPTDRLVVVASGGNIQPSLLDEILR